MFAVCQAGSSVAWLWHGMIQYGWLGHSPAAGLAARVLCYGSAAKLAVGLCALPGPLPCSRCGSQAVRFSFPFLLLCSL